jgi:hypothetical protein
MDWRPRRGGSHRSEGRCTDYPPHLHTILTSQPLNKVSVAAGCDRNSSRYAMRALDKAPFTSFDSSTFTTNGHLFDGDPEWNGEEDEEGSVATYMQSDVLSRFLLIAEDFRIAMLKSARITVSAIGLSFTVRTRRLRKDQTSPTPQPSCASHIFFFIRYSFFSHERSLHLYGFYWNFLVQFRAHIIQKS